MTVKRLLLGIFITLFALIVTAFALYEVAIAVKWVPSGSVETVGNIPEKARQGIETAIKLEEGEQIEWYYTLHPFSFTTEADVITDRRVISFFHQDGELQLRQARYEEIESTYYVEGSIWTDSTISIFQIDDTKLDFFVSFPIEEDIDKTILRSIEKRVPQPEEPAEDAESP